MKLKSGVLGPSSNWQMLQNKLLHPAIVAPEELGRAQKTARVTILENTKSAVHVVKRLSGIRSPFLPSMMSWGMGQGAKIFCTIAFCHGYGRRAFKEGLLQRVRPRTRLAPEPMG